MPPKVRIDTKPVLLVRLLAAIDEGRHSFPALQERLAEDGRVPATRTLRRYLKILNDAGFPWHFDRTANTYRFAHGYALRGLDLSSRELFGLVTLRAIGEGMGGSIAEAVNAVTRKLVDSATRSARSKIEAPPSVAFRIDRVKLDEEAESAFRLLSAAERASRSVRFMYRDKEGRVSRRLVDPYGFIVSSGRIYCVGYDQGRHAMRTFAVDNVGKIDVGGATFLRPPGFDIEAFAADSISGVLDAARTTAVRVRFAARVAKAAIAARPVAQAQIAHQADGGVEITYRAASVDEIARWVLGWGAQAQVVVPASARKRIATIARQILAQYEEAAPE